MGIGLPTAAAYAAYSLALSVALGRAGHRGGRPAVHTGGASPPLLERARLLVIGGTGGTGRELIAQALARDYEVTVLVRDPRRLRVEHPRLRVVVGDVLDPARVAEAMQGQDAVVSALGHKRFLGPSRILSLGTANLIAAMRAAGVRRFVCETALGIGSAAGRMGLAYTFFVVPVILPFYFWDKARQERLIAASGLDWVIVRPAVLTGGARRGACRHGLRIGSLLWTARIARADVAAFMLDQLRSDDYLRAAVDIAA